VDSVLIHHSASGFLLARPDAFFFPKKFQGKKICQLEMVCIFFPFTSTSPVMTFSSCVVRLCPCECLLVLGLSRTALIFTRIQEGAQPGGLTQPGQTEPGIPYHYSIPCAVMLGSGGGAAWRELTHGSEACGAGPVWENASVGLCGLFCVFPFSVSLLLLFPLFTVLLNCPYPDPPVFCLFLSILLCTAVGGGAAAWSFCCRQQPKPKHLI